MVKWSVRSLRSYARSYKHRWVLARRDAKVANHLKACGGDGTVLLSGYPKSGNTWVRFVIFNYYNILNTNAESTLTFAELNSIQSHLLERDSTEPFKPGFPVFYRTHLPYCKVFDNFSTVVYIYRNPLDTMISRYYADRDRVTPFYASIYPPEVRDALHDIDYYVLFTMPRWVDHYLSTVHKAHIVLNYERLRENATDEFATVFDKFGVPLDLEVLERSVQMSSFDSIRSMAMRENQLYGNHDPDTFTGEFTRSGASRQYLTALNQETIDKVKDMLVERNVHIEL